MIVTEKEVNAVTGQETITEREETSAEAKARLDRAKELALEQAEAEAKATAKTALLEKLGISAEEAALLLS